MIVLCGKSVGKLYSFNCNSFIDHLLKEKLNHFGKCGKMLELFQEIMWLCDYVNVCLKINNFPNNFNNKYKTK